VNLTGDGYIEPGTGTTKIDGDLTPLLPFIDPYFPSGTDLPFTMIETPQVEYLGGKLVASVLPPGKEWAALRMSALSNGEANALRSSSLSMCEAFLPMLLALERHRVGAVVSNEPSGTIEGTRVYYYKVTLNPDVLSKSIEAAHDLPAGIKNEAVHLLSWSSMQLDVGFDKRGILKQMNIVATRPSQWGVMKLYSVENTLPLRHPVPLEIPARGSTFDLTPEVAGNRVVV
jgi:hypothetical protein